MTLSISYYDDKSLFSKNLKKAIARGAAEHMANGEPRALEDGALVEWMTSLLPGAPAKRTPRAEALQEQLDNTHLLFLDADLRNTEGLPFLTGERVAYFVRCRTECKAIVLVNPTPRPTFDLRLCCVPQESWADVWIHVNDIDNPWLWSETRKDFAPWYWPNLTKLPSKAERRLDEASISMKLRTLLDLPPEVEKRLPKDRFTAIVGSMDDTLAVIANRRIRDDDKDIEAAGRKRIAVFTVASWIENKLLPGQDVLVDAPHACTRFPGLIGKDPSAACDRSTRRFPGYSKPRKDALFKRDNWVTRSVWWLNRLENDAGIAELDPSPNENLIFVEDASTFVKPSAKPESFTMAIATPFLERFVLLYKPSGNRDYEPAVRLLEA